MLHVRCPECGAETDVTPRCGNEVIAVYCLRHRGGADSHVRPVCMASVSIDSATVRVQLEPLAA